MGNPTETRMKRNTKRDADDDGCESAPRPEPKRLSKKKLLAGKFGLWSPVPRSVLRSPLLSLGAKLLYIELMSWLGDDPGDVCYPRRDVLAWHMGMTPRHIRRCMAQLVKVGVISVTVRRNESKTNLVRFFDPAKICGAERLSNKREIYEIHLKPRVSAARLAKEERRMKTEIIPFKRPKSS